MGALIAKRWGTHIVASGIWATGGCSAPLSLPPAVPQHVQSEARTFEGELSGIDDRRDFNFEGRAGQRLTIRVECSGGIRVIVKSPSGAEEGAPGGFIPDLPLNETGTYRVRIMESPMGESWKGSFRLTINIRDAP